MPFVKKSHRKNPDIKIVGDLCFLHYNVMMSQWRKEKRWTTAHNIYKNLVDGRCYYATKDDRIAHELAWQVFFNLHVMPYERKMRKLNGDI